MPHICISNIGPLKNIDIDLNKINVFIGPQGSGKSTIAKIVSFCQWLEKDCVKRQMTSHIDQSFMQRQLIDYHNMEGYLSESSGFRYTGSALSIKLDNGSLTVDTLEDFGRFPLSKNSYIPAERNIISVPGIFSTKMPANYILDFIDEWQSVRDKYQGDIEVEILDLNQTYRYDPTGKRDLITDKSTGNSFQLSQVASGLQSVTPLCVMTDYLTDWIYSHDEDRSAEQRREIREAVIARFMAQRTGKNHLLELAKDNADIKKAVNIIADTLQLGMESGTFDRISEDVEQYRELMETFSHATFSNIVIEEPELNLFPTTQVRLLYYLLSRINHTRDNLLITTHSPYILYALNNCMLASLAADADVETVKSIVDISQSSWIEPDKVSVWELADGTIRNGTTIQDEHGLIRDNYFDRIMKNVMVDFRNLLNFID